MRRNKSDSRNELLPGTLEMLVLKTLAHGAMHGYGIAQFIRQTSEGVLEVEEGSLYPALQRMQLKGWVESEWAISENNRRARFYQLTRAGRQQLGVEIENYDRMTEAIARVLATA